MGINDNKGELKTDIKEIKERWKEYIEELYWKSSKPRKEDFDLERDNQVDEEKRGPDLLREEIEAEIKEMKKGKAMSIDDIPVDF